MDEPFLVRFDVEHRTRRFRALLCGLPALLLGAAALGVVHYAREEALSSDDWFVRARNFAEERQLWHAECAMLRAVDRGADYGEARYAMAIALMKTPAEQRRAVPVMQELAPLDEAGYPPAHLWRARRAWAERDKRPTAAEETEIHLQLALTKSDKTDSKITNQVRLMLVRVLSARGAYEATAPHVAQLATLGAIADAELLVLTYRLALAKPVSRERRELLLDCRQIAERMARDAEARLVVAPLDAEARRRAAAGRRFLGQGDAAIKLLAGGYELAPTQRGRRMLAEAYQLRAAEFPAEEARRVELLERALRLRPIDPRAAGLLEDARRAGAPGAAALQERFLAGELGAAGVTAAHCQAVHGLALLERGEPLQALTRIEQATQVLGARSPAGTHALAACLLMQAEPDYERALALIDRALMRRDAPTLRIMRARALVGLGRVALALRDLAEADRDDRPEVARLRAAAYEVIGDAELAQRYRAFAEELERLDEIAPAPAARLDRGLQWLDY